MSEKRFTFNSDSDWWTISDTTTNDERLWGQDVVDLLNELAEENQQLINDCSILVQSNQEYRKENEQLKAQLYCDSNEGVCSICKHHYLEKTNMFYISKCEKGHEKCSKESVRHCEDFKLKELQE